MTLEKKGNEALRANPFMVNNESVAVHSTTHGSDWYWAVCAVMIFSTLVFAGLSFRKERHHRLFHYITMGITLVASIAYFSMASNLGWVPINVEWMRSNPKVHGVNRQVFYVRYIDWFITTPLLLLDILLTSGAPAPQILFVLLLDITMVVTGLIGALVKSSYKWGYFAFGCAAMFYVFYVIIWEARRNAAALGSDVARVFNMTAGLTAIVWTLYPIAWGLCEGGNYISPDSEAVFYGVLDIVAKPVFGAILLFGHRGIDPARLGLHTRGYVTEAGLATGAGAGLHHEKHHHSNGTNGANTATTADPAATNV